MDLLGWPCLPRSVSKRSSPGIQPLLPIAIAATRLNPLAEHTDKAGPNAGTALCFQRGGARLQIRVTISPFGSRSLFVPVEAIPVI